METDNKILAEKVKKALADFLGVDVDDIKNEYSMSSDLHMAPSDLVDFVEILKQDGIDTGSLVLTETETFEEFIDSLLDHS